MLNRAVIREELHHDAKWFESHGSDGKEYLGGGMLYYTMAYITRAKVCVCLGSGGGFVPRLMVQAQRDLQASGMRGDGIKVILVDADIGPWGRPVWLDEKSYFRREYPEIELVFNTTAQAAVWFSQQQIRIGYLHVDADHSKAGVLADLQAYMPLMEPGGIITLHDTDPDRSDPAKLNPPTQPMLAVEAFMKECDVEYVNFPKVGCGTAILKRREK